MKKMMATMILAKMGKITMTATTATILTLDEEEENKKDGRMNWTASPTERIACLYFYKIKSL